MLNKRRRRCLVRVWLATKEEKPNKIIMIMITEQSGITLMSLSLKSNFSMEVSFSMLSLILPDKPLFLRFSSITLFCRHRMLLRANRSSFRTHPANWCYLSTLNLLQNHRSHSRHFVESDIIVCHLPDQTLPPHYAAYKGSKGHR